MYEETKSQLLAIEAELEKRLGNLQKDLTRSHSSDSGEQAVERENDEVVESLKHETETELAQVKKSLSRIASDEYGICEKCSEEINPKRLEAMPYSTLCIKCAENQT